MLQLPKDANIGLPLKVHLILRIHYVIQQRPVVVPKRQFEKSRAMGHQMLAFRVPGVANEITEAAKVSAVHETQVGVEAWTYVLIKSVKFQVARAALQVHLIRRA